MTAYGPEDAKDAQPDREMPSQAASLTNIAIRSSYRLPGARPSHGHVNGRPAGRDLPDAVGAPPVPQPPEAIIDWWERLADSRRHPHIGGLDEVTVQESWPNSLLLRNVGGGRRASIEVARIFLPPAKSGVTPIPVDAMGLERVVSVTREVMETGAPLHERDSLPTMAGSAFDCAIIALPFGEGGIPDHVLCHLYRPGKGGDAGPAPDGRDTAVTPAAATPAGRIRRLFGTR